MRVTMFPAHVRQNDNPFISILVAALRDQDVDVRSYSPLWRVLPEALHIHWLEGVFWGLVSARLQHFASVRAGRLAMLARAMKVAGRPVVWTVHNIQPHDLKDSRHPAIYSRYSSVIMPLISDVICMGSNVEAEVRAAYPSLSGCRFHQIPHPNYVDYFASVTPSLPPETHTFLAPSGAPVLAMLGMIRPYKGIPALVERLRGSSLDFRLIVGGAGPVGELKAIRNAIGNDSRFALLPRRLTEPEFVAITQVSDLALFNFQKVLNSGSVLAALSIGTPVLAPRKGAIIDLSQKLGPPWVNLFECEITEVVLSKVLQELSACKLNGPAPLASYSPKRIAALTKAIYAS